MKLIVLAATILSTAVSLPARTTRDDDSGAEQTVRNAERHWEEALKQFDTTSMASLLADDDMQTDFRGVVQDKDSWLRDFKGVSAAVHAGQTQWAIAFDDEKLRLYGDTALVTGQGTFDGMQRGTPVNHVIRFTNVWVNRRGGWRLVNYQATPIVQ